MAMTPCTELLQRSSVKALFVAGRIKQGRAHLGIDDPRVITARATECTLCYITPAQFTCTRCNLQYCVDCCFTFKGKIVVCEDCATLEDLRQPRVTGFQYGSVRDFEFVDNPFNNSATEGRLVLF